MSTAIYFPHLGIHLEHVGKSISVFGIEIAYYGIIIGCGMFIGLLIALAEAKRTGQNQEDYLDFAIIAIIFSIIGARLYYVIFSWDVYKEDLLSIFNVREGGLAIYGGVITAIITTFVFARVKKLSAPLMLDTACLGLVAG
ncbi:MAG: prolipoprotein diacylglyceryl transferase, partial [Lachnospiraceae bacterium]|nr:prolipoprotein diacylglyceryl transferase [Lachnospiraceae bacterium]